MFVLDIWDRKSGTITLINTVLNNNEWEKLFFQSGLEINAYEKMKFVYDTV